MIAQQPQPKLAESLRSLMSASDLSLRQLEKKTGVDRANLSRFANRRVGISLANLERLAEALGCEIQIVRTKDDGT